MGNVREFLELSEPMKKTGRPTYLINEKLSLIFSDADIEGGHGLPLGSNYLLGQFHHAIKSVKCWCGDNDILNYFTPQVFLTSRQSCQ